MNPDFLLTLEEPDGYMASSIYQYNGLEHYKVWVKIGAAVIEVKDEDELDSLIDILNATKNEINEIKKG